MLLDGSLPFTAIDFKTPVKVWSNKPTDYLMLKVFGCPTYYHVNEGKLEPRAKKGVFMGYGNRVKGFRIWSPTKGKVILIRDVTFDELSIMHLSLWKIQKRKLMSLSRWSLRSL